MSQVIGSNLKRIREAFAWTQESLAAAAAVDVRTVQRAEGGKGISAESLRSLAAALDIPLTTLQTPLPNAEDVKRLAAQWNERYSLVPLTVVDDPRTLRDCFNDSCAMHFDTVDLETTAQDREAATLQEILNDSLLIWSDLSPTQRLESWEIVAEQLQAVRLAGLVVTTGHDVSRVRFTNVGDGAPFTWGVCYVIVAKQNEPKLFAVRDKTAPLF